jgi:hypothetical protein
MQQSTFVFLTSTHHGVLVLQLYHLGRCFICLSKGHKAVECWDFVRYFYCYRYSGHRECDCPQARRHYGPPPPRARRDATSNPPPPLPPSTQPQVRLFGDQRERPHDTHSKRDKQHTMVQLNPSYKSAATSGLSRYHDDLNDKNDVEIGTTPTTLHNRFAMALLTSSPARASTLTPTLHYDAATSLDNYIARACRLMDNVGPSEHPVWAA